MTAVLLWYMEEFIAISIPFYKYGLALTPAWISNRTTATEIFHQISIKFYIEFKLSFNKNRWFYKPFVYI